MIKDLRGCLDTIIQEICVPSELSIGFNTHLTCFGAPVLFTPELFTPVLQADSPITFSWNFGDPVTGTANVSTRENP